MRKIRPRCMRKGKDVGYSSLGWLMPCCWVDPRNMIDLAETRTDSDEDGRHEGLELATKDLKKCKLYANMFKEELKLSNVESVEEIVLSTEWHEFFEALLHDTEKVPERCHSYCGVNPIPIKLRVKNITI